MVFQGRFYDGSPSGRVMARSALRRIGSLWASRPQADGQVELSSPSRLENRRPFQTQSRQRTRTSQAQPQLEAQSSVVPVPSLDTTRDGLRVQVTSNPLFRSTNHWHASSTVGQLEDQLNLKLPSSTTPSTDTHGARQLHLVEGFKLSQGLYPSRHVRFRL